MYSLNLLSERVEHFGEIEWTAGFAASTIFARLEKHRLRSFLLQGRQNTIVNFQFQEFLITRLGLLIVLNLQLSLVLLLLLQESLIDHGHLLLLMDFRQIVILQLLEDLHELLRLGEEKLVAIVVAGHVDQAEFHQLLEATLPLVVRDLRVYVLPGLVLPLGHFLGVSAGALLTQVRELHFLIVMDVIVVFEHDVKVELGVALVLLNPLLLQDFLFALDLSFPLLIKLFT